MANWPEHNGEGERSQETDLVRRRSRKEAIYLCLLHNMQEAGEDIHSHGGGRAGLSPFDCTKGRPISNPCNLSLFLRDTSSRDRCMNGRRVGRRGREERGGRKARGPARTG